MPYTDPARNSMLDAIGATHCGLQTAQAGKAVTGVTSTDTFTATAHGYANGDLVVLTAITGGSLLKAGNASDANGLAQPYFVGAAAANTFQLSRTSGGAAVDLGTDVTAGTVQRLVEVSGGTPAYARKAITYAAAANGVKDDSTNGAVFDIPAAAGVDYVSFHTAITAGTLLAIGRVTSETFAAQGTYTLSDAKLDLLSA